MSIIDRNFDNDIFKRNSKYREELIDLVFINKLYTSKIIHGALMTWQADEFRLLLDQAMVSYRLAIESKSPVINFTSDADLHKLYDYIKLIQGIE